MEVRVAENGGFARFSDAWGTGELVGDALVIDGDQVIGAQQAAIANPSGGATIDAEARTAVTSILGALRAHGLIAS